MNSMKELIHHGTEEFPFNIYLNQISDIYRYYSHYHSEIEVIYVKKGFLDCISEGKTKRFFEGDIFFINTNTVHDIKCEYPKTEWLAFLFNLSIYKDHSDIVYQKYIHPLINGEKKIVFENVGFSGVKSILERINESFQNKKTGYEMEIKGLILLLLNEIIVNKRIEDYRIATSKRMDKIKQALVYIESNYMQDIRVEDIAKSCFLNEFYFMRFFKENIGKTVNEYLNLYRLNKANQLLLNTDLRINDIAYQVGYSSPSYFISQYKARYNETPLQVRKK